MVMPIFPWMPTRQPAQGQDQLAYSTPAESMPDRYMYNTRNPAAEQFAPPNNGGPGNPGTANNMPQAKPMLPNFQNNKGPAPLPSWGGGPNGQWNGDFSQFAPQRGGYNGGGINPNNQFVPPQFNMNAMLGVRPSGRPSPFPSGPSPFTQRPPQADPFQQYGYGDQSPQLGRYIPPMMTNPADVNAWNNRGGYSYNIPNSYGSSQWNQFNSRDVAFPQFGQSQNVDPRTGSVREQSANIPGAASGGPPPSYQSPFGRPNAASMNNYLMYLSSLSQGNSPNQGGVGQPTVMPQTPQNPY